MREEPEVREELRNRRISTEDMIRIQLAEINHLRSDIQNPDRVQAWSESLEALADLLAPWATDDDTFQQEWEDRPVRCYRVHHPSGDPARDRLIPHPTAGDCRKAQQIIMGLLDRAGLLVKRRTVSGPRRENTPPEAQKRAVERDEGPDPLMGAI